MPACRIACFLALLLVAPAWGQTAQPPGQQPQPGKASAPAPDLKKSNHAIIGVVFGYTPAARIAYGRRMEELMYAAVVKANDVFRKRHVDAEFRLIGSAPVDYDESGRSFAAMLADLKRMEPVKEKRDATYAAAAVLLVGDRKYCNEAEFNAGPETAYAVVSVHCAADGAGFLFAMNRLAGIPDSDNNTDNFEKIWATRAGQMADFRSRLRWKKIDVLASSSISCDPPQPGYVTCLFTGRRFFIEKLSAHGDTVTTSIWADKDIQAAPDCLTVGPNELDCFAVDTEGVFIHGTGTSKPAWEKRDGKFMRTPSCVSLDSKTFDCFVLASNGTIRHIARRGDGYWSGWTDIKNAITSDLSCTLRVQHTIDCFARGGGGMWQLFWNGQSGGAERRGGGLTSPPACVSSTPRRIDCVARGDDFRMYHIAADGGAWGTWNPISDDKLTSDISCVAPESEHVDCFTVVAGKPGLNEISWLYGRWMPDWVALGGSFTVAPICVSSQPKHIECFERDAEAVYYKYWNGNAWYPQTAERAEAKP